MRTKRSPFIDIDPKEFKQLGYQLVDDISQLMATIRQRPVTPGETTQQLQALISRDEFPPKGKDSGDLLKSCTQLLLDHSLYNGHPKFMGYITSSPAPMGVLSDFLASAVNSNCGAQVLSPIATQIERQTIQWLAEFIGVSRNYGGILVSGGNMANFTAFLAARTEKAPKSIKEKGLSSAPKKLISYCSKKTHTWVDKAAILFGHGTDSTRWIPTLANGQMNLNLLKEQIIRDTAEGHQPFLVIGTAGDVSTGVVDDLVGISALCQHHDLWFHIDGAYGVPAALLPEMKNTFSGIEFADSIAMDPHKWLYAPLEAGCTLVKNPQHLLNTYSSHPEYYHFNKDEENPTLNYYEYGLQNSRGFRALKVWMTLQQIGREGYTALIRDDIELAHLMYTLADQNTELEAMSHNLSITTLRYIPLSGIPDKVDRSEYLNTLNERLLNEMELGGQAFLSNAVIDNKYCLRACIVNFRTVKKDIEEIIKIIVDLGGQVHATLLLDYE